MDLPNDPVSWDPSLSPTSRQWQIITASRPRLVVLIATLAVLRAPVVQTPTANPIVAALARAPVTTHLD
jgi:hypothetical protein